ncbi:MAG: hypothetical protein GXP18_02940 [Gammaproteobacteria bacterium]|nr:hypothetical protein [Gammaproteobacteria bacterium]
MSLPHWFVYGPGFHFHIAADASISFIDITWPPILFCRVIQFSVSNHRYGMTHAFQAGEGVVIHQSYKKARQFKYQNGNFVSSQLDAELARNVLAHIQLPSMLYHTRSYRLPDVGSAEQQLLVLYSDMPGASN